VYTVGKDVKGPVTMVEAMVEC